MFDDMTIEPTLNYDAKKDEVIGFDYCGEIKKLKIADHATVFMARGIRKKWKQPLAFYFSESGMTVPDIVRNLKYKYMTL